MALIFQFQSYHFFLILSPHQIKERLNGHCKIRDSTPDLWDGRSQCNAFRSPALHATILMIVYNLASFFLACEKFSVKYSVKTIKKTIVDTLIINNSFTNKNIHSVSFKTKFKTTTNLKRFTPCFRITKIYYQIPIYPSKTYKSVTICISFLSRSMHRAELIFFIKRRKPTFGLSPDRAICVKGRMMSRKWL